MGNLGPISGGITPDFVSEGCLLPGPVSDMCATWNGIPNEGSQTVLSGTFTVYASFYLPGYVSNGEPLSTTFQIAAPPAGQLATNLKTDQLTYAFGQPIQMTLTETNTGDQPTAIVAGTNFDVTQDGLPIWTSANSPDLPGVPYVPFWPTDPDPTWMTLQPGQSYTQTVVWYGTQQDAFDRRHGHVRRLERSRPASSTRRSRSATRSRIASRPTSRPISSDSRSRSPSPGPTRAISR